MGTSLEGEDQLSTPFSSATPHLPAVLFSRYVMVQDKDTLYAPEKPSA